MSMSVRSLAAIIAFLLLTAIPAAAQTPRHVLVDAATGDILSANGAADRWHPASLTKMMTAYVTFEALAAGQVQAGSPVRISQAARAQTGSRMGYRTGTVLRVDTALKIVIVRSANDVAVALAEAVAGTRSAFVKRMNETARRLAMADTAFVNAHGLHAADQVTSARDMTILARRILLDFPQYAAWFAIPALRSGENVHYSYNLLLERFAGADGMKTGFVCASGYNMVASARRDGRRLVAVVLGAASQTERAVLAARLLSEGFAGGLAPIGNLSGPASPGSDVPANLRPVLCTQAARAARYEPAAGQAVIRSPHLSERAITREPEPIAAGGVDAPASAAFENRLATPSIESVPIPSPRPRYQPPEPIDAEFLAAQAERGAIPVPTRRPQ